MKQVLTLAFVVLYSVHATTPFEQLTEQIRRSTALECRLRSSTGEDVRIVATRGGKYRVESKERTVVSNGSVVWNYLPTQKTVTIASLPSNGSVTFDRVVFELLQRYTAEQQQRGRVILRPTGEPLYGVQRIVLDFRGSALRTLAIELQSGIQQWQIRSLRFDRRVSEEQFEFSVPAGIEIIDMR